MEQLAPNGSHSTTGAHEKEIGATQLEREETVKPAAKPGFLAKTKRHCARFWWVHLIIFCICFLIIALCITYVAMPKIAQHDVDRSHLEVTSIEFLEPTSESLLMTQRVILHSPSIYTPRLDPFPAASYLVTDGQYAPEAMVNLPMPSIHARHGESNHSIENARVQILNLAAVTDYATAVLSNENVTSALVGHTKLHLGKLPTVGIDYNTTITYKGLNGLKGFNVTDMKVNLTETRKNVPNLRGNAYIPNPSLLTIAMGNVTLNLMTEKEGVVGYSTINDMTLRPGDNNFPMTAVVEQIKITGSASKEGIVELQIIGNSSVYNGQHLTYYEEALKSNVLKLEMDVFQVLADSSDF